MLKREDSERGQVIVLFVIVFSIFLMLAAFAFDQGYWYGRRRIVQKDADLPARAGALEYIGSIGDLSGAAASAEQAARDNGVTGTINAFGSETCTGTNQSGAPVTIDAPSVTVELTTDARRFWSALPLISDDSGPVQVGARAVACVGGITKLYVANGDDPEDDDNTLKGIPIAIRSNAPGPDTCFSGGTLQLGGECVIFGSKAPQSGFSPNVWARRRIMFTDPSSGRCRGSGSVVNNFDEIEDGLDFTCTVTSLNTCTNDTCIWGEDINEDENAENVFDAMEDRLGNSEAQSDCEDPENSEPEQSFQNAFGNGNGYPDFAPDPPALGGGPPEHVYVQNDCYGNPRIVVLPILSSSNTDDAPHPVRGFATVYITGCYHEDAPSDPGQMEENECDGNWDMSNCNHPVFPSEHCRFEIRAIPVHMFITEGSLGGISEPATSAPLTIQTVQ
jgi:hypothetical protein